MRAPWEEDVLSEAGMDDDFVIKVRARVRGRGRGRGRARVRVRVVDLREQGATLAFFSGRVRARARVRVMVRIRVITLYGAAACMV